MTDSATIAQAKAEQEVEGFKEALGPFVVAAETTRMAMAFTNAKELGNPIIFANDSLLSLMEYDREELLGERFDFLLAQPGDPDVRTSLCDIFRHETDVPVNLECRRKSGEMFPAAIYVSPVRDEAGNVVQHFSSFVDLTTYHQRQAALDRIVSLQSELIHVARTSALGTMATMLAHELNQPLTAVTNLAAGCRLRLAGPADDAGMSRDLIAIEKSALRAGTIIGRLRALTRGGAAVRGSFDLNEAIAECVELVLAGACQDVSIESETEGTVMIEADRVQIQQVVINLLKNGCEATAGRTGARVTVSTKLEEDRAVVSVDDTGPGLSKAATAKLFQWESSTKTDGMGIGLSISRTIVEAHQGRIWLGTGVQGRTQICFCVPAVPAEESPTARPDRRTATGFGQIA